MRDPCRYAVVMAQQRSGTHLLGACLDSHTRIAYSGEIFCRNVPEEKGQMDATIAGLDHWPKEVLCLDIKYNQISAPVERFMNRSDVRVIHLVRLNQLAMYYSGAYQTWRGEHPGDPGVPVIEFDRDVFDEIAGYIREKRMRFGYLTDLKLYYEELTGGGKEIDALPEWASRALCITIGVPFEPLQAGACRKESPLDYLDHLSGVPEDIRRKYA